MDNTQDKLDLELAELFSHWKLKGKCFQAQGFHKLIEKSESAVEKTSASAWGKINTRSQLVLLFKGLKSERLQTPF